MMQRAAPARSPGVALGKICVQAASKTFFVGHANPAPRCARRRHQQLQLKLGVDAAAAGGESLPPSLAATGQHPGGDSRAAIFRGLSLALGVAAVGLIAAPTRLAEKAFLASPNAVVAGCIRMVGASHLLAAIVASCLAEAAAHNRLSSDTYKRLSLGLASWGAASIAAVAAGPVTATKTAQVVAYTLAGMALAVAGATFHAASDRSLISQPVAVAKDFIRSLPGFVSYSSPSTAAYSLSTKAAALLVPAMWTASIPAVKNSLLTQPLGALGRSVLRIESAGLVLAAFVLYTLTDAAKRQRLGASTFKTLNLGITFFAFTFCGVTATWVQGGVMVLGAGATSTVRALGSTNICLTALLGSVALYNYFTAKK